MTKENIWNKPISHGEILKNIWKNLDLGTLQRRHPFHQPVFATMCDDAPELRTVVLRRFWRRPPCLAFHSHCGSPKVNQIRANPNVYWLFYHAEEKLQVRIKGIATIHTSDELAEEQWQSTELFSRRCYIGEAPTQASKKPTSGLPEDLIDREPTLRRIRNRTRQFRRRHLDHRTDRLSRNERQRTSPLTVQMARKRRSRNEMAHAVD